MKKKFDFKKAWTATKTYFVKTWTRFVKFVKQLTFRDYLTGLWIVSFFVIAAIIIFL